ncbi:MAG: SigB/SigF/SigG family RNA polymerase sigma factor [Methylocystaceae bacterium]
MQDNKYQELEPEVLIDLINRAQKGEKKARETLFVSNQGLIYMVLERFKSVPYDYQDLYQVGSIGLIKAIDKFDASYGVRFSTYAVPLIIGEIKRYLRDDGPIKIARNLKELYSRVKWAQESLNNQLGRPPTVAEIAAHLEVNPEDVTAAVEACQSPYYMFDILNDEEKNSIKLIDCLQGTGSDIIEQVALKEALTTLDPREQEVIRRRYFGDQTQTKVAQKLGISQVQVSRIERAALKKLRRLLV